MEQGVALNAASMQSATRLRHPRLSDCRSLPAVSCDTVMAARRVDTTGLPPSIKICPLVEHKLAGFVVRGTFLPTAERLEGRWCVAAIGSSKISRQHVHKRRLHSLLRGLRGRCQKLHGANTRDHANPRGQAAKYRICAWWCA